MRALYVPPDHNHTRGERTFRGTRGGHHEGDVEAKPTSGPHAAAAQCFDLPFRPRRHPSYVNVPCVFFRSGPAR